MGKQTKRERKFQASGGVKRRLEKGTVTKKGKLRKRKKRSNHDTDKLKSETTLAPKRQRGSDFLGEENLGDLDIESFFEKVTEAARVYVDDDDDDDEEEGADKKKEAVVEEEDSSDEEASEDDVEHIQKAGFKESLQMDGTSSDESDDDDVEAAEARMKAEMASMQETDPDFHEFLEENEESLLEFGQEEDEESVSDAEDEPEEAREQEPEAKQSSSRIHLTKKVLDSLEKGAFKSHGIKSLKKLVAAYKSACHLADASGASEGERHPGESGSLYVIDSSILFDELMVMCLSRCHEEFHYHLLGSENKTNDDGDANIETDENKPINPKSLEKAAQWSAIRPIMLSFLRSTLHVMSEAKEPELLVFILKALSKYLRFMSPFPRIAESMLRSLTGLWSAPLDTSEDYQLVRINAFFRIRQLALTQPFPFIEDCLKKTYLAYAKRAKFGTAASVTSVLPTLTFMGNCLVQLYSLDYHSSYQHAFVYIRQLALLLRAAMQKKTTEAMQKVYCWQYVHCLKLWVAVLSAAAQEDDGALMRSLIYPLTEVILGTLRLVPSPTRHIPLRFHLVRLLQQLASSTEVFIPSASFLLDCLDWKEWYMSPKKDKAGSARGMQIQFILKLPKEDTLRTHEQLETCINELFLLLNREIDLYRYSPGFPEFSIRIVQRLRLFAKEVRNPRWRTFARSSVETCERYADFAVQARSKLNEAPKDVQRLEFLRPVSEKTMRERYDESVQKEQRALDAARSVAPKSKTQEQDSAGKDKINETKKIKKQGKVQKAAKSVESDSAVLEQEDTLHEGIWSDED